VKRVYEGVIEEHFAENRQMLFLIGPRQVGKTTTSLESSRLSSYPFYLNWDNQAHRLLIMEGAEAVAQHLRLDIVKEETPILVFDEIHKFTRHWKDFLKGFFDTYGKKVQIMVTGSARLDVLKSGGDSLMGRYFLYRLHPLSIREIVDPTLSENEIRKPKPILEEDLHALIHFGGFPEPFIQRKKRFYTRWKKLRTQLLFQEDLAGISQIQEVSQMQVLTELLRGQVGSTVNYNNLALKVHVASETIKRWIETLKALYYCFTIQPWTTNISRAILKEPKVYLWDWSLVNDMGARLENLTASHLLKAIHFWNDRGFGDFGLYFLRDKEKREVDFLVTKEEKPWFLVEAKSSHQSGLSKNLYYYQEQTKAPHAFQIAFDLPFIHRDCFAFKDPVIVPASTFLSQLT